MKSRVKSSFSRIHYLCSQKYFILAYSFEQFTSRHIGPNEQDIQKMLNALQLPSLDALIEETIPKKIRLKNWLALDALTEPDMLAHLAELAAKNQANNSYIGQGYYGTITPSVIKRNILENPGWYTQYTPYQAEIAQGRLEALLNFQTMVCDLTGLPVANASLLDEATAAAEAMSMLFHQKNKNNKAANYNQFFVDAACFEQVKEVIATRAWPLDIEVIIGDPHHALGYKNLFGLLLAYPAANGELSDYTDLIHKAKENQIGIAMTADLMSLVLLESPAKWAVDIVVGSSQRYGIPLGYGGPHAAFMAVKEDLARLMPGRIIGVSTDRLGKPAYRMSLQTREQHIRREKATSNICTAQALLAIMAGMYAVYHGPEGLKKIANRINWLTNKLAYHLQNNGYQLINKTWFDTLTIDLKNNPEKIALIKSNALNRNYNFHYTTSSIGISFDETTTIKDLENILSIFSISTDKGQAINIHNESESITGIPNELKRTSNFLTHQVFNLHHSETEMMRYIKSLENKDLSLTHSMIALGSCTMKLNAATELYPISWPQFSNIHPYVPKSQCEGYTMILYSLADYLCAITGFSGCSLQPNSGAQGEYAGLLVIKKYHEAHHQKQRTVMLIPSSAHGTNPASAIMAGMQVIVVACDKNGNVELSDLKDKAILHADKLAGCMITYPSTHGVFEESIIELCEIIHQYGGLVYMDGANMNAQVGYTNPGTIGADVCHLNLHKTFAIPHGGGGPGMGPICVHERLKPYLPHTHFLSDNSDELNTLKAVSAAPYGSASILLISYAYIKLLGANGLQYATAIAILNANYMKAILATHYEVLYEGANGRCAHEFILDFRPYKNSAGIEVEDVAKRLMDYGFHAPTVSFPVAGTLMIEPTESEPIEELERFCDALIAIRQEIKEIEDGLYPKDNNVLKNAPHTLADIMQDDWNFPYTRNKACSPLSYVKANKFWPSVNRINNAQGDRNLICTCPPIADYS